jgi:hypothetical protein
MKTEPGPSQAKILSTQYWLEQVVIAENFCPFAKKEFERDRIRYTVFEMSSLASLMSVMESEYQRLNDDAEIETTLVILQSDSANKSIDVEDFDEFLMLVDEAKLQLQRLDYDGRYQLATFHPNYLFAGEDPNSPSHFTNRSPFPMLHIIREASIERAFKTYKDPEGIPERNIKHANQLGVDFFKRALHKAVAPET